MPQVTHDEREEYFQLLARIELGGNDGADIYEFEQFARNLELKYNLPIEHIFPPDKLGADGPV